MKTKVSACLVALFVYSSILVPAFAFSGGSGTAVDPYQISNIKDLWDVRTDLSKYYKQTAEYIDIAVTNPDILTNWEASNPYSEGAVRKHPKDGFAYYCITAHTSSDTFDTANWTKMWEAVKGWEPIGTESSPFTGNYDGDGNTISNLYINRGTATSTTPYKTGDTGEDNVGLFGYVSSGFSANTEIKNVGIINPKVRGRRGTGSLIGKVMIPARAGYKVVTSNCYAQVLGNFEKGEEPYVKGFGATGGLVGANNSDRRQQVPVIQFCWSNVTVASTHPENTDINPNDPVEKAGTNPYNIKYGGIVGCNETGVTFDSYATGNITGGDRVGGVAGCAIDGAIIRCYATGNVTQNIVSATTTGVGHVVGAIEGKLPPGLGGFSGSGTVQQCYYPTAGVDPQPTVTPATSANSYASGIDFSVSDNFVGFDPAVWDFPTKSPWDPLLEGTIGTTLPLYYYYTFAGEDWDDGDSVWERTSNSDYTGGSITSVIPDMYNALGIKILHAINLNQDVDVNNMLIADGASLTILSEKTLTVQNGANTSEIDNSDLVVDGSLNISGTLLLGSSATVEITTIGALDIVDSGTIDPGVASNFVSDSSTFDYTSFGVDGYSSVSGRYLKFPPTNDLIKPFSVSVSTPTSNMPNYINRQWQITGTAQEAAATKTITFYWNATDDNSYDWAANNAVPSVFRGETELTRSSYDIASDPRSITVTVPFSEAKNGSKDTYTIGREDEQTLPVELSAFTISLTPQNEVKLQWATQSETNVMGFQIYRATVNDLEQSQKISSMISATNTSQMQNYLWIDKENLASGRYYYWLESVDYDGSSDYYGPVNIFLEDHSADISTIPPVSCISKNFPNPFNPDTSIIYGLGKAGPVSLEVYNIRGQRVRKLVDAEQQEGWYKLIWDGSDDRQQSLPSGVYYLRLNAEGKHYLRKTTLMK